MDIQKWKTKLKPKFPTVIENLFGRNIDRLKNSDESLTTLPSVNVEDANKAFEVSVALPGLDKKDVRIEVKDDVLSIRSEKQYSHEENRKSYIRKEFGYAAFQRMFQLPPDADPEKVQADMKNGLLHIKVAKKPSATSSKIIKVA